MLYEREEGRVLWDSPFAFHEKTRLNPMYLALIEPVVRKNTIEPYGPGGNVVEFYFSAGLEQMGSRPRSRTTPALL